MKLHFPLSVAIPVWLLMRWAPVATATPPVVPVFKEGQAQIVAAFADKDAWIRHDLWVETEFDSDGDGKLDRMHVSVTRPQQTETAGLKLPVIYISSPYFGGTGELDAKYSWSPEQELGEQPSPHEHPPIGPPTHQRPVISNSHIQHWLPRGFIVVHSSSPGTGLSQGCPTVGGRNESLAPKAVIDWLCGRANGFAEPDANALSEPPTTRGPTNTPAGVAKSRPAKSGVGAGDRSDRIVKATWCNGSVGMTGTSYNGTLPIAAASTGVKGLKAIIPIAPNTSYYHYYRSNGLVRHPGGYIGEDIDVLYDFIHSGDRQFDDFCDDTVRDDRLTQLFDRAGGDYNDFWASRDYLNQVDKIRTPTLVAHAFNDWNVMPEHSVRLLTALKRRGVPTQAYFHQGGHGGPPPMQMMNRWFTRYLFDRQNGVEQDPRCWIVREQDARDRPTPYVDYPNPNASLVEFRPLRSEHRIGKLQRIGTPGRFAGDDNTSPSRDRTAPQGIETVVDNYSFDGGTLARAEWTNHRLLYATAPLKTAVHLSGTPRVTVRLAASKPAANLSVWVVSLPWNSDPQAKLHDNIITRGWADPQNHRSIRHGEPLIPGRYYDVTFDLQPDDQIIPAGQRIGVMIFSSDREFTLWPEPGTELSVDLDHTRIRLPIVTASPTATASPTVAPE